MITVQLKKVKLGNGETLAYRERSGGHIPLVLIHGNMTSSKHWDIVLDRMDECYKIYAVDMRGFGESSYHRGIASIKDLSDDIKDWVDGLGLRALWNALIYSHNQPEEDRYEEYIDDMRTQRNLAHIYQALNMFNISDVYNGLVEGTDQAASISIPVLVLRGDRDYVITKEMTEEIVEDIGENATFVELKNSGHSPLIDDVDQLLQTMTSFLQMKEEPA